jgi:hypothetical protein
MLTIGWIRMSNERVMTLDEWFEWLTSNIEDLDNG